jgi:hypothetical protein
MPPIDWAQVIIAVVSAAVTYFFSRRTTPATPTLPAVDPVASHPVIQGILTTLARIVQQTGVISAGASAAAAPLLNQLLAQPMTINIDGHQFTIDASGLKINTASPTVPPTLPSLVPSKN